MTDPGYPRWLCAYGGAELFLAGLGEHDPVQTRNALLEMKEWYRRFGHTPHPPVHAGEGVAEMLVKIHEGIRLGSIYWAFPWRITWPAAWEERLRAEARAREKRFRRA